MEIDLNFSFCCCIFVWYKGNTGFVIQCAFPFCFMEGPLTWEPLCVTRILHWVPCTWQWREMGSHFLCLSVCLTFRVFGHTPAIHLHSYPAPICPVFAFWQLRSRSRLPSTTAVSCSMAVTAHPGQQTVIKSKLCTSIKQIRPPFCIRPHISYSSPGVSPGDDFITGWWGQRPQLGAGIRQSSIRSLTPLVHALKSPSFPPFQTLTVGSKQIHKFSFTVVF